MQGIIRVFHSHTTATVQDANGPVEQKTFYHTPTTYIWRCTQNAYNWLGSYGFNDIDIDLKDYTR